MLQGKQPIQFKRAVFLTEDAYYNHTLNYNDFCKQLRDIAIIMQQMIGQRNLGGFKTAGNWAAFSYMTDTIAANNYKPYVYDFDDFMGAKDWSKMFVTKLLRTHSGNCHSLPYLYKMICEEVGAKAYLALAPNHVYIKHQDEHGQWTNVELTNPGFPRDQWIIKEMAISVEAIKHNIYMAPLSPKESVALTMYDLALGYRFKFGYDRQLLHIVNTALVYFPTSIMLIELKADCVNSEILAEKKKTNPDQKLITSDIAAFKQTVASINYLGYKDMPPELYKDWVHSVELEKEKRNKMQHLN
jgi:hypothetical protein